MIFQTWESLRADARKAAQLMADSLPHWAPWHRAQWEKSVQELHQARSELDENTERIMDAIEAQRALNNKHFMQMWRLAFKHAPEEAREIQRLIRQGDLKIAELNKQLCD